MATEELRYITKHIQTDLKRKMVFVAGPRQCGKTTMAQALLRHQSGLYLNWDDVDQKKEILKRSWHSTQKLVILDELHKFSRWKNWIKGTYDTQKKDHQFLVTGSARLDVYRRGGDSLLGRYHLWRLHPFSLSEVPRALQSLKDQKLLERFLECGGFPEPLLEGDSTFARRWRRDRLERVVREDIRDLEPIRDLGTLKLFIEALKGRVGQLIVLSNIAADLQVAPKTLKHWLEVLERMYVVFIVRPFTKNLPRSLQKPFKVFFYDTGDVDNAHDVMGAKIENLVAAHLLKQAHYLSDRDGYNYELYYLRDKEGREVDFAITRNGVIQELVEVKWADQNLSPALKYYVEKLRAPKATQVVAEMSVPKSSAGIAIEPAVLYLKKTSHS